MKKALYVVFLLALPMFLVPLQKAFATEPSNLVAVYSVTSPTIDGQLGGLEWWDAAGYKVNVTGSEGDIEVWLYLKHDGSHMYVGLVVWQIYINAFDQFTIFFDEGDDGSYGSGTRDMALTVNQEDLKSCNGIDVLRDGCYKSDPTQFHSFDVEIDFYANASHETDHSPAPWEIEYWEGLAWVDDHWECEFSIPLVGTDGAVQDVSDLNCTVGDTVGFKLQYFINPGAKNYYYPAGSQTQILNYTDLTLLFPPVIESCDSAGIQKDSFDSGEPIYANGSGYAPSTTYDFYIVNDVETWTDGLAIPSRISDTAVNVTSDASGDILPTIAWNDPQTVGLYDIIVDLNGNGLYDEGIDVLDNNDIEVTAGFMVPEFASASILTALIISITLCAALIKKNKAKGTLFGRKLAQK